MQNEGYDALDMKCRMIVDEYDAVAGDVRRFKDMAQRAIMHAVKSSAVEVTAVEARVKERGSLIGKLERKGSKYAALSDLTDIIGVRIITLFCDDVDRVAMYMTRLFDIDWDESVDKRASHGLVSFGYNSLHYIARIPSALDGEAVPDSVVGMRFEIQMRSTLQHAWAAMEHDIGYKSAVGTPPEYRRMFSRLAGALELVDEEFARLRISVADYRRRMETLIKDGMLSEVRLDDDTFDRYVAQRPFEKLTRRIAAINQGEVHEVSFKPFLPLLVEAGLETLQDVEDFIRDNEDDAYQFAMSQLASTDIDIVASTIALQDMLIVHAMKAGQGKEGLRHIYDVLNGESEHNEQLAGYAYKQASALSFMPHR